jgi:hypothetical protein
MTMRKINIVFIILACGGAVAVTAYLLGGVPQKDYSLTVDAMRDDQSLFVSSRIILTNNGKFPLSHINVNYGIKNETINILNPGEKISLSPPEGSNLNIVKIIEDHGINLTTEYRRPIKLPGMIGS